MVARKSSKTNPFDSDDESPAKPGYQNPFDDDEPKKDHSNPFDDEPLKKKGGDLRQEAKKVGGIKKSPPEKNPFDDDGMWSNRGGSSNSNSGGKVAAAAAEVEPRARRRDAMKEKLASVSDDLSSKASQGVEYLRSKNVMGNTGNEAHNRQLLLEEEKKKNDPQIGYSRARIDRAFKAGESLEGESVQELQEYAVHRAEETTTAAYKALKLAEDIRETATNTSLMLHEQGQQITRTHETAANIDLELSRGEKLLGSLGGLFSRTWKPKKTRNITGPVLSRGDSFKRKAYGMEQRAALGLNKATSPRARAGAGATRNSTGAGADSSGSQFQSRVKSEFDKQDDALGDLSKVLDQLKEMSFDMGSEIGRQTHALGHVEDDVDELGNRVRGANERARRLLGR